MANPETINPTDDGWAGVQGSNQAWATIRAATGTIKRAQADGTSEAVSLRNGTSSNTWDIFRRALFVVSASLIPTNATLVSGTKLRLFVNSKTETLPSMQLILCNGGPASTALATTDYEGNVSNNTAWGDTLALSAITTSAYNEWNFNAAGMSGLQGQLGSNFKFQLKFVSDQQNVEPGSWSSGRTADINWNFGNAASNKSQLVIAYTLPPEQNDGFAYFMSFAALLGMWGMSKLSDGQMTLMNVLRREYVRVLPI